jgi:8-oxo-dGTP pyrophosphatase MutT (NUDIX family)
MTTKELIDNYERMLQEKEIPEIIKKEIKIALEELKRDYTKNDRYCIVAKYFGLDMGKSVQFEKLEDAITARDILEKEDLTFRDLEDKKGWNFAEDYMRIGRFLEFEKPSGYKTILCKNQTQPQNQTQDQTQVKFNNEPNKVYKTVEGKEVWESRSVAVVVTIIMKTKHIYDTSVLLVKRNQKATMEPGKYCLPCGYLDWEEDGHEAAIRETYEETGIYIPDIKKLGTTKFDNIIPAGQPWFVNSSPSESKLQNVSLHYGIIIETNLEYSQLPKPKIFTKDEEIEKAEWVKIDKLSEVLPLAFYHDQRIGQFIENKDQE